MKTKNVPNTEIDLKSKIRDQYLDHVLSHGKNPTSVYVFAKNCGIEESEFYEHFNSFDAIEKDIWQTILQGTIDRIQSSTEYGNFSVREKILTFYYTLIEELKARRSYVSHSSKGWIKPGTATISKEAARKVLEPYFEGLISEGFEQGELIKRSVISDFYKKAMVMQFWFVLDFWLKDTSPAFEDTDAAIEKAVNLGFEIMKENTVDKAVDLAKFLWGRK